MNRSNDFLLIAQTLLLRYKLHNWNIIMTKSQYDYGECIFKHEIFKFSYILAERYGISTFIDTVLHEIAHAMVGPGHGHDITWKNAAKSIGCSGEQYGNTILLDITDQ